MIFVDRLVLSVLFLLPLCRRAQEADKEQQMQLDVYKNSPKDVREKRDLLVLEKKLRDEIDALKAQVSASGDLSKLEAELAAAKQQCDTLQQVKRKEQEKKRKEKTKERSKKRKGGRDRERERERERDEGDKERRIKGE